MTNEPAPETPSPRRSSTRLAMLGDGKRAAEDGSPKKSPAKKMKEDVTVVDLVVDVSTPVKEQVLDVKEVVPSEKEDTKTESDVVSDATKTAVNTVSTETEVSFIKAVANDVSVQTVETVQKVPDVVEILEISNDEVDSTETQVGKSYEDLSDDDVIAIEPAEDQKTD